MTALKLLIFICFFLFPASLHAQLSPAYIRLSNPTPQASPGAILITATPSQIASETSLELAVGSAWPLEAPLSTFSVSTADLPSDVTPWPGIASPTHLDSQTLTFPSSDLTPQTTYGFYLSGLPNNPNPGISSPYHWNLTTFASTTPVDQVTVPVSPTASQLQITGAVPAKPGDITLSLTPRHNGPYAQDTTITYDLTVTSLLPQATPVTVQVSWANPTLQVIGYNLGSAQTLSGIQPLLNPTQTTLTWTVPSLAAQSSATTSFRLITTKRQLASTIPFTVSASIIHPFVSPVTTLTGAYLYQTPPPSPPRQLLSCNSACSSDSDCDTGFCEPNIHLCRHRDNPTDSSCQLPSASSPLRLLDLSLPYLSTDSLELTLLFNQPSKVTLAYGTSPSNLNQTLVSPNLATSHSLLLKDLNPQTTYYLQATATTNTHTLVSDLLIVTTTSQPSQATLVLDQTHLSFRGIPLLNALSANPPNFIAPQSLPLELTVYFSEIQTLRDVNLVFSTSQLLGLASPQAQFVNQLFPLNNNSFSGRISVPDQPGFYFLHLYTTDIFGNLTKYTPATAMISPPITLTDTSGEPLEGVRVRLERFLPNSGIFLNFLPSTFTPSGYVYTNSQGQLDLALSAGRYRLIAEDPSLHPYSHDFDLDAQTQTYPQLSLTSQKPTFISFLRYHLNSLNLLKHRFQPEITPLSSSLRFYNLTLSLGLLLFGFITLLSLSSKLHQPLHQLPHFLRHHLPFKSLPTHKRLRGRLLAENGRPLSGARLIFTDPNHTVIASTSSNLLGQFHLSLPREDLHLLIVAPNHQVCETQVDKDTQSLQLQLEIPLFKRFTHPVMQIISHLFANLFEFLLFASFALIIFFLPNLGLTKLFPFIFLTLTNLTFYLTYLYSHSHQFPPPTTLTKIGS